MKRRRSSSNQTKKIMSWESAAKLLFHVGLSAFGIGAYANIPSGIIGGVSTGSEGYAEFVFPDGTVSPISGLSGASSIDGVAINEQGLALIGGLGFSGNGYAAYVLPDGTVNVISSIPSDFPSATVFSTAMNLSGLGLVGGMQGSESYGYADTVTSDGSSFNLISGTQSAILSVALNSSGVGLIGGEGYGGDGYFSGYAAYVVDNAVTQIPINNTRNYSIVSLAVNEQGNGIVGGYPYLGYASGTYAAFVNYNTGSPTVTVISGIPGSYVNSVAINDLGLALIGGQDSGNAFVGFTSEHAPTVTNLFDPLISGTIVSVAINNSGTGLIGGSKPFMDIYAAFVQSNGSINPLDLGSLIGEISSVAINEAGVGLIGGTLFDPSRGYAALIAPNGAVTLLDVSDVSSIYSVALNNVTNAVVPASAGSYFSAIYTQLAVSSALEIRFIEKNSIWNRLKGSQTAQVERAQDEMNLACNDTDVAQNPKRFSAKKSAVQPAKQNSIWVAPFGDYVHLKAYGAIPNYTNTIGGALLGYDHEFSNFMLGGTLGYAFDYIHYSQGIGHGKLQEEMASFYGSYQQDHFRLNGVLWGGLYQFRNTRHSLSMITSTSSTNGWILSPHIEMASPWAMDQNGLYFVEPFFMLDWISSWQSRYTEKGPAGFNLKMNSLYSSLLQSEVGFRFYEQFGFGWGDFRLEEKVSYVNQAPFVTGSVSTSFVAAASSFPIAVASTKVENLAALEVMASFVPKSQSYPYGGFKFQVTGNSSYQSYFANGFIGMDF